MFWRKKEKKLRLIEQRFIETGKNHGIDITTFETSKPILPARKGFSFTVQKEKPE